MYTSRNRDSYTFITSNDKYDFYISKHKLGKDWYTEAWIKDTKNCVTMAGFSTKQKAIHAANSWSEWMN